MFPTPNIPNDPWHNPGPPEPESTPESAARSRDPLAVAVGNASLLGIGYVLLGSWGFAIGSALITIAIVAVLVSIDQPAWFQLVVVLWWVAVTVHGWHLAGGRRPGATAGSPGPVSRQSGVRKQRFIAFGVTIPVLLAVGVVRVDAWRLETNAAEAHRTNECSRALDLLAGLGFRHHVADAPLVVRADDSIEACELLVKAERQAADDRLLAAETLETYSAHPAALWKGADGRRADLILAQATHELDTALSGNTNDLEAGFGQLARVLEEFPDQRPEVDAVLDGFLDKLPVDDACNTKTITDWLGDRSTDGNALDRASDVVPRVAPAAIVGCGNHFLQASAPQQARDHYEQLLDQYADHDLAAKAERGIERADLAIQLTEVRRRLQTPYGGKPEYCGNPAPYAGAKPYRDNGPYPTLLYGNNKHKSKLPSSWKADSAADAVLVVCVGDTNYGSAVETCTYESESDGSLFSVTFHNREIPVRVYEVRTGDLVSKTSVEVSGDSCPYIVTFYEGLPPSQKYVSSSASDVREAYESLIDP